MDINLRNPGILTCLIILSIEVFTVIFAYAFITYVILCDLHKKKHLLPITKLRFAVHTSCFCFTVVSYVNLFCDIFWPDLFKTLYSNGILILLTIYSTSSIAWLTALLCFFYFTKIVDVRSDFLGWAKMKINSSVHFLIVVINLMCLGSGFLSILFCRAPEDPSTNSSLMPPASITAYGTRTANFIVAKFLLALISVPFLTVIISVLLSVRFLKLHGHTMGKNMRNSTDDFLIFYQNVASRMSYFFMVYAVFYLVLFLFYFLPFSQQSPGYWVTMILVFSFTPIQFILSIIYFIKTNTWKDLSQYIICSEQFRACNH